MLGRHWLHDRPEREHARLAEVRVEHSLGLTGHRWQLEVRGRTSKGEQHVIVVCVSVFGRLAVVVYRGNVISSESRLCRVSRKRVNKLV